jgi:hypothetical protein
MSTQAARIALSWKALSCFSKNSSSISFCVDEIYLGKKQMFLTVVATWKAGSRYGSARSGSRLKKSWTARVDLDLPGLAPGFPLFSLHSQASSVALTASWLNWSNPQL